MKVNYIEHFLILASTITRCVLITGFFNLLGISMGIRSSETGLKICEITVVIKSFKLITKKKEKNKIK